MFPIKRYIPLILLLTSCSREPEKVVVEYRFIDSKKQIIRTLPTSEQTLTEKTSSYAVESGLAKKLWQDLPEDKKWNIIKSLIDYELRKFTSNRISRLQDNFREFYNFCQETRGRLSK